MTLINLLLSIPYLVLVIVVAAVLGRGLLNVVLLFGITDAPIFARLTRGEVLRIRHLGYIEAANAIGSGRLRILSRHIFPNALAPLIVEISLSLAFAILAEAALSFFGLGTQPPDASWGRMLSEGRAYFRQSIWLGVFPGLAIMLTVMGFNFLGDGLRDVLDPRMRDR